MHAEFPGRPLRDASITSHKKRVACRVLRLSKRFHPRSQVDFVGPGVAGLLVEHPVSVGDVFRVENAILFFLGILGREVVADQGGVDGAIADRVDHVDAFRPKLPDPPFRQST